VAIYFSFSLAELRSINLGGRDEMIMKTIQGLPAPQGEYRPSAVIVRSVRKLIHTCYRVLDLDRSIGFYEKLGLEEIGRIPIRDEAINVFMGLPDDGPRLELTYNVGRAEPYEVGTGYGHIAITVEDMDATLERLAAAGIEPERPPYSVREGGSRLCFVRDPDDYRIELIESDS
jgi:lactoylglutathione lyase